VATIDDADTAVKSYLNVHKDFDPRPRISGFHTITSAFAHGSPGVGIYNFADDIWLNGVADDNATELMIWTENRGRTYSVFRTGRYIAFVDKSNTSSGSVNLRELFDDVVSRGWVPAASTIGQIDYGVEIVSTDGRPATFEVNNFSLTTW